MSPENSGARSRSVSPSSRFSLDRFARATNPFPTEPRRAAVYILILLLCAAAALRCYVAISRTSVVHPDELFQYLEQAHRLAFGSGVVPWEYDFGIRSWLLPTVLSAVMKVGSWVTPGPLAYIFAIRLLAATLSLVVVVFGFTIALRKAGLAWALITGLFCSIWFHALFLSPSIQTDVLAAYLMFPAILLVDDVAPASASRTLLLGVLLALAFCLRFQLAPALFLIACWHCRLDVRNKWIPLTLSGGSVVLVVSGVLDALTLGRPFQSIWLNFQLNAVEGVSTQFGRAPLLGYFAYLSDFESLTMLPLLLVAFIGAYRSPLVAATCAVLIVSLSLFSHKEYRFISFVFLALPTLIGLGASSVADIARSRLGLFASSLTTVIIAALVTASSYRDWSPHFPVQYLANAGVLRAFLAAHDEKSICGLGVADYRWAFTGGYTYFNKDVPIYYSAFLNRGTRDGYYGDDTGSATTVPLEMHVQVRGKIIPQYPQSSLLDHTKAFNYLVAASGRTVSGYKIVQCFRNQSNSILKDACLLQRPGPCR